MAWCSASRRFGRTVTKLLRQNRTAVNIVELHSAPCSAICQLPSQNSLHQRNRSAVRGNYANSSLARSATKSHIWPRKEFSSSTEDSAIWKSVSLSDVEQFIERKEYLLVDVREPVELEKTGQIGDSVNIPLGDLYSAFSLSAVDFKERYKTEKPKPGDGNVVLYCMVGGRSKAGLDILEAAGFKKIRYFPGGWKEWSEKTALPS